MNQPRVSIVVITYNEKEHMADCAASLGAIEYPRDLLEIILVDSQSTDGTAEAARATDVFDKILTTQGEYRSPGKGQETGFAAAAGEYVCVFGADTEVNPQWLNIALRAFSEDTTGKLATVGGNIVERNYQTTNSFVKGIYAIQRQLQKTGEAKHSTGGVYKLSVLREHDIHFETDIRMEEEVAMGIELRSRGYKLLRLADTFITHESAYTNSWKDLWFQVRRTIRVMEARSWLYKRWSGEQHVAQRALLKKHGKEAMQRGAVLWIGFLVELVALVYWPMLALFGATAAVLVVIAMSAQLNKKVEAKIGDVVGYVLFKLFVSYCVASAAYAYYRVKHVVVAQTGYPRPQLIK